MRTSSWRTPAAVLFCGGMILTIALGVRHNFGLYLQPMTADLGIGGEPSLSPSPSRTCCMAFRSRSPD